jgi:hypothetical protein
VLVCTEDDKSVQEAVDWLLIYQQPESRLYQCWAKTAKIRLNFIHTATDDGEKVTLQDILSKWPRYKDKNGDILVSVCN